MILIGYALTQIGWFDERYSRVTSKLVTQIALPCYMINTITSKFSRNELFQIFPDLKFPILSMTILFIASYGFQYLLRINPEHYGLFKSMFSNSNTVFVGLPVNMALFGKASIPYVLIYYMANTTFFWTLGVYLIRRDGDSKERMSLLAIFKKIFSPPLLGFMFGVVLVLLNIKLPNFILTDTKYIGSLTIPLSMFFIGMKLAQVGIRNIHFSRDMFGICFGRFILAPLLTFVLVYAAHVPDIMKEVFVIQSAMPVMTNAPVVAKLYNADSDYAAVMVTTTTVLSLIVVPILMNLVTRIF
ncbi:MAG: AEC family transporter [Lactobacillus sp.]|uniref:AEC family transporter n=2 Tax=Bombilactobacillus bombi TaxID=1303590 RepID=A0A347SU85_9LACO|nr:AEC family transporter [Bombilactobacillus bombi]MCO6541528.1 AEC family transporter [Lactobacillus sp.]MCO6543484.1 AEC family transporter [Lactobacillus sp.]RHW45145.1 AEC family transporter [Bombilactobacillus bombi]RHW52399.1 AEC family transporter [Bombilactobacillus bombi]